MEEINIHHLSWSQINLYLNNPRGWWYQYVKYPERRMSTPALKIGLAYHEALEMLYKGEPLPEALANYDNDMAEVTSHYAEMERDHLRLAIEYYYNNIFPMYKSLVNAEGVERHVEDFVIEGVPCPIHMRIDVMTIDDRIIDHKTVGRTAPRARNNGQGLLYAYWFYKKYGKLPRSFELHRAYKNPQTSILVDIDSAPFHLPDVLNMAEIVKGVYKSIQAGIFHWGLNAYPSPYKDEYDTMLIKQS